MQLKGAKCLQPGNTAQLWSSTFWLFHHHMLDGQLKMDHFFVNNVAGRHKALLKMMKVKIRRMQQQKNQHEDAREWDEQAGGR